MMLLRVIFLVCLFREAVTLTQDSITGQDFSCSVAGAGGEDACDASTATDGTSCVWCSYQSFGVCVNENQAEAMKKAIPGITCDTGDDDQVVDDDDSAPDDDDDRPTDDDDDSPPDDDDDDDTIPDDYWKCVKNYTDENSCSEGGCTWCNTKAGYGICLDKEAAEKANDSTWFDCPASTLHDPHDTSCLEATLQGNDAACEATVDKNGQSCEWCSVSSVALCLTSEQAQMAEQFGGTCANDVMSDPYDTSCLQASLEGDEATCEATVDEDGQSCEWCSMSGFNLCLTSEQAQMAEQFGGSCANDVMSDPYDTSCLQASLEGDEATCEATVDEDGQSCEWCSMSGFNLCLTSEQAQMAEQFGGSCANDVMSDPYDTSCLQASLEGDEATCEATVDGDGQSCEWCSMSSFNLCLTSEQAQMAEQFGGSCANDVMSDPYDTSCLQASLEGDEATCEATVDEDGQSCEWCSMSGFNLCLTSEQAQMAEQFGGDCDQKSAAIETSIAKY